MPRFIHISNTVDLSKFLHVRYTELIALCTIKEYDIIVNFSKRGKKRLFYSPNIKLKYVQQRLNRWFQSQKKELLCAMEKEISTQFQVGFSCIDHATNHIGKKHILQVDIKNFFESISSQRVNELFFKMLENQNLAACLTLLTTYKNILPIGAPSSSSIAELIVMSLDEKLLWFCKQNNLTYSRYVDDLCFSSDSYIDLECLLEIEKIVKSEKFRLNYSKTRFNSNKSKQTVTGITVNEHLNVDRKYMRLLRSIVHSIEKRGLEESLEIYRKKFPEEQVIDTAHFSNIIKGKLSWVAAVKGRDNKEFLRMQSLQLTQQTLPKLSM